MVKKKIYQGPLDFDWKKKSYTVGGKVLSPEDKLRIAIRIEDDEEGNPDWMTYDVEFVLVERVWNTTIYARPGDKFTHTLCLELLAKFLGNHCWTLQLIRRWV